MFIVVFIFIASAQTVEIDKATAQIATLFKKNSYAYIGQAIGNTKKDVLVFDDRIEVNIKKNKRIFYYTAFCDYDIRVSSGKIDNTNIVYIHIEDFTANLLGIVKEQADNLIFIRSYYCEKQYTSQLDLFVPVADKYRALEVKPTVSEEQRKYIVQANGFNDPRNYDKAIELYQKAIEVDQTAYPGAYSNLALLSAQVEKFDAAIYYMKKYLMLEPESPDARSAQDKIYLWEARPGN
jgi:tetratricopeptide (TPR) repeat protein